MLERKFLEELRAAEIFRQVPHSEIIDLLQHCEVFKVKRSKHVFLEGVKVKGIYFLRRGVVKSYKIGIRGREQIFHFFNKGDVFGIEPSLLKRKAGYSARVIEDIEYFFIPASCLEKLFEDNYNFRISVLRYACEELKVANDVITDLCHKRNIERVMDLLCHLNKKFKCDKNNYINIPLKRDDLANKIGASQGSVIRLLSDLKKQDKIKTLNKKIGFRIMQ